MTPTSTEIDALKKAVAVLAANVWDRALKEYREYGDSDDEVLDWVHDAVRNDPLAIEAVREAARTYRKAHAATQEPKP